MEEFDWDFENITHIAGHGLSPHEVELALSGFTVEANYSQESGEERYAELGQTPGGRVLLIWTTLRSNRVRVVTAYDAPKAQVQIFFEERGRA